MPSPSMAFPASPDLSAGNRERNQRLQSAKQKLKSYRAKQAQMERAKRQSTASATGSTLAAPARMSRASSSSLQSFHDASVITSVSDPRRASLLVGSIVNDAANESNAHLPHEHTSLTDKRHSRQHSRMGSRAGMSHTRGHSRSGSISVSQMAMGQQVVQKAVAAHTSLPSASSTAASASAPSLARPASTFVANTPHSHTRGHSRSGSRSLAARSRPPSFIAPKVEASASAAADNGSGTSEAQGWRDIAEPPPAPAVESDLLRTPTLGTYASDNTQVTTPKSTAGDAKSSLLTPSSVAAQLPASPASVDAASTVSPQPPHSRRQSRHARKGSVSTRRESMEIMGGLNSLGINVGAEAAASLRHSRRISSQRWSGLQPASVLFGGPSDVVAHASGSSGTRRSSVDGRGSWYDSYDNDGTDRLTALEKLEGRSSASKRHSRQESSVQLPSFDDVHGEEGMDKRASLSLMESNEKTTSSDSSSSNNNNNNALDRLAPPVTSSRGLLSPSSPHALLAPPNAEQQAISVDSSTGEGLGTLMEEEEEDEESALLSPVREKGQASFNTVTEEEQRRRKELEQEVIKRTRRTSLQPKPLKLKSRPASLYAGTRSPQVLHHASQCEVGHDADISGSNTMDSDVFAPKRASSSLSTSSSSSTGAGPAVWSLANAQRKTAEARLSGALPDGSRASSVTASPEKKRAWRSSMPVASSSIGSMVSPMTPTNQDNLPLPVSASPTPSNASARSGMRALRLATTNQASSSSASSSSPAASASAAQHKSQADSTSSISSSASQTSAGAGRRASLVYSTTSAPFSREETAVVATTPANNRRSSIQYRASPFDAGSSPAATSENASSAGASTSAPAGSATYAASPVGTTTGVPMHLFEELKAKHQRDISALDETRKAVARLETELRSESDRTSREYRELEHWSAEEKRGLGQRIEHLEASLVEVTQVRTAMEEHFKSEMQKKLEEEESRKTDVEDIEAERDMLRDDVEGWRQRCSDLERVMRTERQTNEELRRVRSASKLRINELLGYLQERGVHVPRKSIDEMNDNGMHMLPNDLVTALRSPALGAHQPFFANAAALSGRDRDGSVSPNPDAETPPPQAIKLLKDMRQQIFNLAGSLEHERKQHLQALRETDQLKADNARISAALADHTASSTRSAAEDSTDMTSLADDPSSSQNSTKGVHAADDSNVTLPSLPSSSSDPGLDKQSSMLVGKEPAPPHSATTSMPSVKIGNNNLASPPRSVSTRMGTGGNNAVGGKKARKHVFAYDSSMESGMGSFSAGDSVSTHQTSEYHGDGTGAAQEDAPRRASAATDNEDEAKEQHGETLLPGPHVAAGEAQGELHGLGVSSLDTLAEEEEANAEAGVDAATSASTAGLCEASRDSFDIEAGRPSDAESSLAPSTPALDHARSPSQLVDAGPARPTDGQHNTETSISATSSQASNDLPLTPQPDSSLASASQDTLTLPPTSSDNQIGECRGQHGDLADDEEDEGDDDADKLPALPPHPRPEFIREWSFEDATAAVRAKNGKPKLRVGTMSLGPSRHNARQAVPHSKSSRPRRQKHSIDDFFGIMSLDEDASLPPLPTPEEALDMPPLIFTDGYEAKKSGNYFGALGYDSAPRYPTIRPPVAKTSRLYGRSLSDRSSGSGSGSSSSAGSWSQRRASPAYGMSRQVSNEGSNAPTQRALHPQYVHQQQQQQQQQQQAGMFGRVMSFTSAFSGLGGYLYGSDSSAGPARAAPHDHVAQGSASWAVTPHDEEMA